MRHNHTLISRLAALAPVVLLMMVALVGLGGGSDVRAAAPTTTVTQAQAQTQAQPNDGILVLHVYYRSIAERNSIAAEFGVESPPVNGYIIVWADQTSLDSLRARGLRVEIDPEATRQANEPVVFGHNADTFFGGYYTVEEMQSYMDAKVASYPTLAQKVDFGDSWCKVHPGQCTQPNSYNGYDMYAMRVTNQAIAGPKPVFWFNAGLHSREIVPPEVAIRFINWLLDNYNTDADARWLVDYHDIWVVPMSNPDGHHIVEAGSPNPYTQRKNANKTNGCTTWPPGTGSQFGTDLNRNFIFMWNCCGGSSGTPCNLIYRGPSPVSESETFAISSTVESLIPDQRGPNINDPAPLLATGVFLDMHSNATLDLYPWGQTTNTAPNDPDLKNIARHFGAVNAGGNGYTVQQSVGLYPTDGASDDSTYGQLGAAAFTIELQSGGSFTPPYTTVNTDWNANKGALTYLSKIARTPYLTTRGPDANLVAAVPMTVTQGTPSIVSATINYAWTNNVYLQNVAAAEYYIDTPPWAGGTGLPMSPTDGNFNSPTEGAQATVNTGALAPGQHLLLVRGRGVNDYEGNQSWGPISATFIYVLPSGGATSTPTTAPASPTSTAAIPSATSTATTAVASPTRTATTTSASPTNTTTIAPSPTRTATTAVPSMTHTATPIEGSPTNSPTALPSTTAIATATQTATATATATVTLTRTTPPTTPPSSTPTGTPTHIGAGCAALFGTGSTDCSSPTQYNYSFSFYNESGCNTSASGGAALTFDVAETIGGTYTRLDTQYRSVTFPAGPSYVTFTGTLTINNIPAQYTAYRIGFDASSVRLLASATAGPAMLCGQPTFTPTTTPTACTLTFSDVPPDSTFYPFIRCLSCLGIINGYPDGTFRPGNNVTRGQLAKIVSNAAGFNDPQSTQLFEDVAPGSTFFDFIGRLASRGYMTGYQCGGPGEPCGPGNLPYFRPNANATRGQISKIVSNAAGFVDPPGNQLFEDVAPGSTFFDFINRLAMRGYMTGYPCGGPGEPCGPGNLPYFRPNTYATRGQTSKIVANTFFPQCNPPRR